MEHVWYTWVVCLFYLAAGRPVQSRYRRCQAPSHTIAVSLNGFCMSPHVCRRLSNCTTYYGNLIFRTSAGNVTDRNQRVRPHFPHLREITGYLMIGLFNQDRFTILPALTVIRGHRLLGNYALIIYYCTELKEINFSSLTTILHGGVRIEKNNNLCYVDGVKWSSIVRDKFQGEQFGVVVRQDNPNCDTGCYSDRCKVVAGHGDDPNAQHCWGPGGNGTDYQCQKFCNSKCGLQGCVEGSTQKCCGPECLGGCMDMSNVTSWSGTPCYACRHYRIEQTGQCVEKCPSYLYLVSNLTCERSCPASQYSLGGTCVESCPSGYKEKGRRCVKCVLAIDGPCPKICYLQHERIEGVFYNGSVIRLPKDIERKGNLTNHFSRSEY